MFSESTTRRRQSKHTVGAPSIFAAQNVHLPLDAAFPIEQFSHAERHRLILCRKRRDRD